MPSIEGIHTSGLQVDRLITELKLPPNDAYHKLRHTIEEVNALLVKYGGEDAEQVSAAAGTVQSMCAMLKCCQEATSARAQPDDLFGAGLVGWAMLATAKCN